jgi:PhnB protein
MPSINPYLTFDGNCEEAFEFYRSVFGGEFSDLNRFFSEAPSDSPGSDEDADRILHLSLPIGDGQVLMGSDRPSEMGPGTFGDSVAVSIAPDDADSGRRIFEGLSAGGQVTMPYERQFWGADFGMCTDKYGIHWMVNYTPGE